METPLLPVSCLMPLDTHIIERGFLVTKSLMLFNAVIDSLGLRFLPACDKYMHLFLDNANTGYAEASTTFPAMPTHTQLGGDDLDSDANSPEPTCYHR